MIVDRLGNRSVDAHVPQRVRQALEYLRTTDMAAAALGRHDIDGDRLFALVQEYKTRPAADCVWEAHRRYVDVQYIVRGAERMGHAAMPDMLPRQAYDAAEGRGALRAGLALRHADRRDVRDLRTERRALAVRAPPASRSRCARSW